MPLTKRKLKALAQHCLDLFVSPVPPPPTNTLPPLPEVELPKAEVSPPPDLPDEAELSHRFDMFNEMYFQSRLPKPRIIYSNRMRVAGSFTPADQVIKIGRKYHEIFPQDINDTLKHEMIHLIHFHHNADFKREARRIGTSLRARSHPSLRRPPKYTYACPDCGRKFPRQKRLVMASCGKCSTGGKFDDRFKLKLVESRATPKNR